MKYTAKEQFLLDFLSSYNIQIVQGMFDRTELYLEQFIAWKQKYANKTIWPLNKKEFF